MAYTTKPTNELIRFVRGTKDQYAQINKRNDTLYFVYDNENSPTGELYLGSKQIGDGTGGVSSLTELISGVITDGALLVYDETTQQWVAQEIEDAVRTMVGATATSDGMTGLVPVPQAGDQNKFLRGDGTWAEPTVNSLIAVDGNSIELNSNDEITIKGFSNAPVGSFLQKTSSGLSWTSNISVGGNLSYKKVESLNDVNEEATIYFVPNNSGTNNLFNEYMYIDGSPELIGSIGNINLDDYVNLDTFNSTVGTLQTSLNAKANKTALDSLTTTVNEINEKLTWQEIVQE